ncbi:hypothetical protein ACKKBG_A11440 [Auxenochlorella protothecoides x Auxenochlorella symbiontica]
MRGSPWACSIGSVPPTTITIYIISQSDRSAALCYCAHILFDRESAQRIPSFGKPVEKARGSVVQPSLRASVALQVCTGCMAPYLERATGLVLRSWEQLDVASLPRSIRALRFSCYINPVTDLELSKCLLQLPNLNKLRLSVSRELHQALLGPGASLGSWVRLQKLELVVNRGHPSYTLEGLTRACPNLTHLHNHEAMNLPSDIGDLQSLRHVAVACSDSTRGVAGIEHLGPSQALTLQVGTVGDLPPAQSRCRWVRLDETDRSPGQEDVHAVPDG